MSSVSQSLLKLASLSALLVATAFGSPAAADILPKTYDQAVEDMREANQGECEAMVETAIKDLQERRYAEDELLDSVATLGLSLGAGAGTTFRGAEIGGATSGLIAPAGDGLMFAWNARVGGIVGDDSEDAPGLWYTGYGALVFGSREVGVYTSDIEIAREELISSSTVERSAILYCTILTSYRETSGFGLSAHYDAIIEQPGFGIGLYKAYGDLQESDDSGIEGVSAIVYPPFPHWGGGVQANLNYPGPWDGASFQWGYFVSVSVRGSDTDEYVGYFLAGIDLGVGLVNVF